MTLILSLSASAAEVFVVQPEALLVQQAPEDWKVGDGLCVETDGVRSVCGTLVERSVQGVQMNVVLQSSVAPQVGDEVTKVDPVSRVKEVLPFSVGVRALQSPVSPWQMGDAACVYNGNTRLDCGEVTEVGLWEATLTFSAQSGRAISPGFVVWKTPGSARTLKVEGNTVGFAQSKSFPWKVGDEFELRTRDQVLARGRVSGFTGALVNGVLQSGSGRAVVGLWVAPLARRIAERGRRLSSLETRAQLPSIDGRFVVVGWNTVMPTARVEWQFSPFLYAGAGVTYLRLGLDGGTLSGPGLWLSASYYPRGEREGPWMLAAVIPVNLSSVQGVNEAQGLTIGGLVTGGWQGRLGSELDWGVGAGLQFLGDTGLLNSTGLFPAALFQLSYRF